MKIKNICCIGAGFVGGPTMAVFSKYCPDIKITLVDINEQKIQAWNSNNADELPVFEKVWGNWFLKIEVKIYFFHVILRVL